MARWVFVGSLPASHAITASTANSGNVCSHARIASANPCDIKNCAASAPHAMTNAEKRMEGNVQIAEKAVDDFSIIAPHSNEDDLQPAECVVQARASRHRRARGRDRDRRTESDRGCDREW